MNDEFSRPPPMLHLKDDGSLKHPPPTIEKKKTMVFVDQVKSEIPGTSQPLKHFYEKSLCKFVRSSVKEAAELNQDFDFVQWSIACPQFENIRRGLGKIRREVT